MNRAIRQEQDLKKYLGFQADAEKAFFGLKLVFEPKSIRNLRANLLGMAYWLSLHNGKSGIVVLVRSQISKTRLLSEWELLKKSIHPSVISRYYLIFEEEGKFSSFSRELHTNQQAWIRDILKNKNQTEIKESSKPRKTVSAPAAYYNILKILINEWIFERGSVTSSWLMEVSGYSYPTVKKALDRMGSELKRSSSRSVQFDSFPKDEWAKLCAVSDEIQPLLQYSKPQLSESNFSEYIEKFQGQDDSTVALAGLHGLEYHFPEVDLPKASSLYIAVHQQNAESIDELMKSIDPELTRSIEGSHQKNVYVRIIETVDSFFSDEPDGFQIADPVHCLLDLVDAGQTAFVDSCLRSIEQRHLQENLAI
ncbi:hypothetical protein K8I28_09140 [bacterium]|nr:hypothetical protein [bacterium]